MRAEYPLYLLSDDDFESLVVCLCKEVLGIAASTFATGRDGGRDSKFVGTASCFPSDQNPWSGTFIIQAKHTKKDGSSCSDNRFYGNKTSVIALEVETLKKWLCCINQYHPVTAMVTGFPSLKKRFSNWQRMNSSAA